MARPLPLFGLLVNRHDPAEGPENVRVFEKGRFLYGSFDYGREQVMDIRAHDRLDLLEYWIEWMAIKLPSRDQRHERTPQKPARPSGEFAAMQAPSEDDARSPQIGVDEYLVK